MVFKDDVCFSKKTNISYFCQDSNHGSSSP